MAEINVPYSIVVAVDYSEAGDLALERALELAAERPSAAVHVVNVLSLYQAGLGLEPAGAGTLATEAPSVQEAAERLRQYVEKQVSNFRASHPRIPPTFPDYLVAHQRVEMPSEEISQLAADLEADLVVVGTHGRRGFSRFLLGSVAEATVRLAPCPVLVVRPKAIQPSGPAIQPPCPKCVEKRFETRGAELWCEQHRERHGQRHTYHQGDRAGAEVNLPLVYNGNRPA
jgi:nucleotide-binding universal stress UspA family protein